MNKKVKKEAVLLSDGTVAKVGKIVVVINGTCRGNKPETITKITRIFNDEGKEDLCCEAMDVWNGNNNTISTKTPSWYENLKDLRKATPEERKQYYSKKYSKVD